MLRVNNLIGFGSRRAAGGGAATPVVWDAVTKTADLALSNGDATATAGSADEGAFGTVSKSAGKWYFELVMGATVWNNSTGGTRPYGLANSSFVLGSANLGGDTGSIGLNSGLGDFRYNGSNTAVNPDPGGFSTAGAVLMIAVDLDAQYFWFGVGGSWAGLAGVAGNPGAGTTPVLTAFGTGPWFPCITNSNASGSKVTIAASASDCTYSLPSGFSYWSA